MTVAHKDDWFRKANIDDEAIRFFESKLAKSRSSRREYMRIQAHALASEEQHSRAISMIERIECEDADHWCLAWLYQSKAESYRSLGQTWKAVEMYRAAIARQKARPSVFGSSHVDFPFWIATERIVLLYDEAVEILVETIDPTDLFPVTLFKQYASLALIMAERREWDAAKPNARAALAFAARTQSNAANHRSLGLVGERHTGLLKQLKRIALGKPAANWLTSFKIKIFSRTISQRLPGSKY